MAHYAFLDKNNIVTEVIVGVDENELIEGVRPEDWYGNFRGQTCIRTSYNTLGGVHLNGGTPLRKNFAGIGYIFDAGFGAFIAPQPYPSWKLNYTTYLWEAPVPEPEITETNWWKWSEYNKEWIAMDKGTCPVIY